MTKKKSAYKKPKLSIHGELKDVTSGVAGSGQDGIGKKTH